MPHRNLQKLSRTRTPPRQRDEDGKRTISLQRMASTSSPDSNRDGDGRQQIMVVRRFQSVLDPRDVAQYQWEL
jgi:hypothetical protein